MKSAGASLLAHMQGEVTTLCTCWKVTRTDGRVFGFTDHTSDLTISGVTYSASTGYTATAIKSSSALNVDNLDVQGALDSTTITDADLLAGLWDFATVEIFVVNYADTSMGSMNLRKGNIGNVQSGRGAFVTELRGMMQRLQQAVGRLIMPACNADLGDARCGINLGTFPNGTATGTVTSISSNRNFTASDLTGHATGWFDGGLVTFTSGDNEGLQMEVKTFTSGGAVLLFLPMPYDVALSDTFTITAGCDKSHTVCNSTFSNTINFRGFPHLPGLGRLFSGS